MSSEFSFATKIKERDAEIESLTRAMLPAMTAGEANGREKLLDAIVTIRDAAKKYEDPDLWLILSKLYAEVNLNHINIELRAGLRDAARQAAGINSESTVREYERELKDLADYTSIPLAQLQGLFQPGVCFDTLDHLLAVAYPLGLDICVSVTGSLQYDGTEKHDERICTETSIEPRINSMIEWLERFRSSKCVQFVIDANLESGDNHRLETLNLIALKHDARLRVSTSPSNRLI